MLPVKYNLQVERIKQKNVMPANMADNSNLPDCLNCLIIGVGFPSNGRKMILFYEKKP